MRPTTLCDWLPFAATALLGLTVVLTVVVGPAFLLWGLPIVVALVVWRRTLRCAACGCRIRDMTHAMGFPMPPVRAPRNRPQCGVVLRGE